MSQKKALVLGGSSDIGGAIVRALSPEYEVIWTYNNTGGGRVLPGRPISCDFLLDGDLDHLFSRVGDELDLLVTSAFPFLESHYLDFGGYTDVEPFLRAHVFAMTEAAARMQKKGGGRIVNILGQSVERGLPGAAFYAAAFAFLHSYGNSINAREGKAGKVAVCDLLLGPVDTREWNGVSGEVVERYKARVSQFISTDQVAATVKFLISQPVMPSTFKLDAYYGY